MARRKLRGGLSLVLGLVNASQHRRPCPNRKPDGAAADWDNEGAPTRLLHRAKANGELWLLQSLSIQTTSSARYWRPRPFQISLQLRTTGVQQHKDLKGNALVQAVDKQSWNESVKALTQFPTVLNNMAKSLTWTSQLGEAYHNQRSEVMSAIQTLRKQAKDAGHLKSTSQIKVEQQNPQTIVIKPANPDVVYVPEYNPAVIYGVPYTTPGYTGADVAAASAISFGAGIALGALAGGGWGWNSWGCNWSGGTVNFQSRRVCRKHGLAWRLRWRSPSLSLRRWIPSLRRRRPNRAT